MKDLYSFHENEEDLDRYYKEAKEAYFKVFKRFGLNVKIVEASGGAFSKYSHEFQVFAPAGEDKIFYCDRCEFAQNREIVEVKMGDKCPNCKEGTIGVENGIEVGNIFKLMTKFSQSMGANYTNINGQAGPIIMGTYGIGLTRCLATIVEIHFDFAKNKMVWPKEVAPFLVHLISIRQNEKSEEIYNDLRSKGVEVLCDDRDISVGQKFAEADLIGCPYRLVISEKSLESGGIEFSDLINPGSEVLEYSEIISRFNRS
jgi:prolyl-tRNA synthetase